MPDSPTSEPLDLSPEALHERLDEGNVYLPPRKPRAIWLEADVYLTAAGRAVFPDGRALFVRAGEPGAETAEPIAVTIVRVCGCREDDGQLVKPCAAHAVAA